MVNNTNNLVINQEVHFIRNVMIPMSLSASVSILMGMPLPTVIAATGAAYAAAKVGFSPGSSWICSIGVSLLSTSSSSGERAMIFGALGLSLTLTELVTKKFFRPD